MIKKLSLLTTILLISGCGTFFQKQPLPTPEVKIVTKEVAAEIYQPPMPRAIELENVKWYVINSQNINEKIAEIEKQLGGEFVVFALTPQSYENMAYNLQEIRRYVLEQKQIILYYRQATQLNQDQDGDGDIDSNDWLQINKQAEKQLEK